jgi:hypothetical protein
VPPTTKAIRANVMVAESQREAVALKRQYPQFRFHVVITPGNPSTGFKVNEYVWTPGACGLSATTRLALRGLLAPLIDEKSTEEEFPATLLIW